MSRTLIALTFSLFLSLALAPAAVAAVITEEEAHAIGVDAYLYFYPLVTMDVTRKQLTNQEPGKGTIGGPMNAFSNIPTFPADDMKSVVRPNFDTLYSSGWLDLTKEPMVVSVPDGRPLLSSAHARHVDGRVRLAGLAHHRHASGELPGHAARLAA